MIVWNLVGKVNGRRIELESDPGLPPGTTVTVNIEPQIPQTSSTERLLACAGAWKDDDEIARIFDEIAQERDHRTCRDVNFDAPS